VFRYRVTFRKEGPARWIGHLDLVRAMERACRRAGLPLWYSEGFNPRPRFVFALPLPVGHIGLKELVDVYLRVPAGADAVQARLAPVLPGGIVVVAVARVPREAPNLMAAVQRASYVAEGGLDPAITPAAVEAAVRAVLDAQEIKSVRQGKAGRKERDVRPGIFDLAAEYDRGELRVAMTVKAGQQGNIRPEEVVEALLRLGGLPGDAMDFTFYRTGLFVVTAGRLVGLG
jgi:radical SAM-linked protein